MKLTTATLCIGMLAGAAWGQNPDIIDNTRSTLNAVQQQKTMRENEVLSSSQGQTAKAPAPAGSQPSAMPVNSNVKSVSAPKPATTVKAAVPKVAGKPTAAKAKTVAVSQKKQPKQHIAVEDKKKPVDSKNETKKINLTGRRDPFVSPVINRSMLGSGCSTGKKCLSIEQIDLKGVVKSDAGMIAVVVNSLEKAYFLRENDPVFNGYVVKITPDSIVFKQTLTDKLGKPFTREVTKKITTPAV
jgi:Tfp pilus assembly protein PilP